MQHATTIIGRILLGLVLCLGLVRAEMVVAVDCRAEAKAKPCACCASPEAGCCAASENQPPAPVPALPAPVAADGHFDLALVSRPLLVVLPVTAAYFLPKARNDLSLRLSGHSLQALLCLRTV